MFVIDTLNLPHVYTTRSQSIFFYNAVLSVQVTTALAQVKPPTPSTPVPQAITVSREPQSAPSSPVPVDPTIRSRTPPVSPLVSPVHLPNTAPRGPQTQAQTVPEDSTAQGDSPQGFNIPALLELTDQTLDLTVCHSNLNLFSLFYCHIFPVEKFDL